jgi:ABC-type multidrug transport system fused ATPase/permease subunit
VLDKGKLMESGNHDELMQEKGIYFEFNVNNGTTF